MGNSKVRAQIRSKYVKSSEGLYLNQSKDICLLVIQAKDWSKLRTLSLVDCRIGDEKFSVVADRKWPYLLCLELTNNQITERGVIKLAKNQFPSLSILSLNCNRIGDQGIDIILQRNYQKLKNLYVQQNNISFLGLGNINSYNMRNIRQFSANLNNLGARGVKLLVKADMPFIESISLRNCIIGDEGLKFVTKSNWQNLKYLTIGSYKEQFLVVRFDGIYCLRTNYWKNLEKIQLYQWKHSPIGMLSIFINNWQHEKNKKPFRLDLASIIMAQQMRKSYQTVFFHRFD